MRKKDNERPKQIEKYKLAKKGKSPLGISLTMEHERVEKLREILAIRERELVALHSEIDHLRKVLAMRSRTVSTSVRLSPDDKIALFRKRFFGREDVFAVRWESTKSGKSGYQPYCLNEWKLPLCEKPKVKCSACANRRLASVDNQFIRRHLIGCEPTGRELCANVFVLSGRLSAKKRREVLSALNAFQGNASCVIVATGRYIGEGFDCPRLDILFLAQPVSWSGILEQYVGRLHRLHAGKRDVRVYDYVDIALPVARKMFARRRAAYSSLGYAICHDWELPLDPPEVSTAG